MADVVVVDDNEIVLEAVKLVLERRGHDVRAFQTVADAMASIEAGDPPDLVLADLDLGAGATESGFDLVARVDEWSGGTVPVVVLSGLTSEEDFARAFEAGARDFISKPVSPNELLAKCAVHLGSTPARPIKARREPGGVIQERFRVGEEIGAGSYGAVYAADDLVLGRQVALKFAHDDAWTDREAHARFLRETQTLQQVRSPHIVDVLFVGVDRGRPFYAMDWISGSTVEDRVTEHGTATRDQALGLLRGMARALVALERADLVHRDLKPANVMLRGGRFDEPVLVDFGLAKRQLDRSLTRTGYVLGTPGYLAPEVVRGSDATSQSDVFSLGAVVRFALCGEHPFPDLSGYELIEAMATQRTEVPDGVDPLLRELLELLLEPDLGVRPTTAEAILDRLSVLQLSVARLPEAGPGEPQA